MDQDHVERNYRIIEESMKDQMERSFEIGKELIDSELDAGLFNFVVKPIVKTFYSYWQNKDARSGTLKQIKVTLDTARKLVNNGHSEEKFERLVEQNFPDYLEGDQTSRNCKKSHRHYDRLVKITKEAFISQVRESVMFLSVQDDVKSYDDLCRSVFSDKQQAYKSLKTQLDLNEEAIKIVERHPSILKVFTGKDIIIKVLRKGFEITKKELMGDLNQTFNN